MAAASRVFAQRAGQGGAATLVIRGGIVHSVDNPRGEARDIVIEGDTIADIVAPGSVTNVDAEILDAARRLVVPGLINAHTHSHGGLSKGVGDLWSLELLLNAAPWIGGSRRTEDKYLAALSMRSSTSRKARPLATTCSSNFRPPPSKGWRR